MSLDCPACKMLCKHGYVKGKDGCDKCECKKKGKINLQFLRKTLKISRKTDLAYFISSPLNIHCSFSNWKIVWT